MTPGTSFPIGIAGFCWIISGWLIWISLIFCFESFGTFIKLLVLLTLLFNWPGIGLPFVRAAKAPTPPTANTQGIIIPAIAPPERPPSEDGL